MSRLGDLILLERTRQKLTRKQVARKCGVSEGYKDVEEGRRIIQDDQARRILKTLGTSQRNEAEFSLDEIAATVDLGTLAPAKPAPQKAEASKPRAETGQCRGTERHLARRAEQRFAARADYERRLCPNRPPHAADSGWQNRRRKAGARALFPSAG